MDNKNNKLDKQSIGKPANASANVDAKSNVDAKTNITPKQEPAKKMGYGSIIGSTVAGLSEIAIFHPLDTIAKRLMSHESKVFKSNFADTHKNIQQIALKENAHKGWIRGIPNLYPGLGFAVSYKISQRVYKYAGQHELKSYINKNHKEKFDNIFGEKNSNAYISAFSGSLIGMGEVALLPVDVLKIKSQTNPETFKNRSLSSIILKENFSLYNGWQWTMLRNAPGSFALFGASTFTKNNILGLSEDDKTSLAQYFICSTAGSVASIAVSSPMDVIKTRIQNKNFGDNSGSGFNIISSIIKNEGPTGFFRGIGPKLLVIGPKLTFSFTIAQYLTDFFGRL
jgi:hypothetical protein